MHCHLDQLDRDLPIYLKVGNMLKLKQSFVVFVLNIQKYTYILV